MKKSYVILVAGMLILAGSALNSSPTGTPQPASGGPAEGGATCFTSGCHTGAPQSTTSVLSTDVPAEGYNPGETYHITITVSGTGHKGFQISAQKTDGTHHGALVPGTGTWSPFANYVTHSTTKFPSPAVWTVQWIAPAAGTGPVNIYGAFAITRSNTRRQVLQLQENVHAALNESDDPFGTLLYPVPAQDQLFLAFGKQINAPLQVTLLSTDGKICLQEVLPGTATTPAFDVSGMSKGLYLLRISSGSHTAWQKVLIGL
jgi:hypothetical protein